MAGLDGRDGGMTLGARGSPARPVTVINLVSSSPLTTPKAAEEDRSRSRITTPTFQSFRTQWLATSERSPLAPKETHRRTSDRLRRSSDCCISIASSTPPHSAAGAGAASPLASPTTKGPSALGRRITAPEGRTTAPKRRGRAPRAAREPDGGAGPGQGEAVVVTVEGGLYARHVETFASLPTDILVRSAPLATGGLILCHFSQPLAQEDSLSPGGALLVVEAARVYDVVREARSMAAMVGEWKRDMPPAFGRLHVLIVGGAAIASREVAAVNRHFRQCVLAGHRLDQLPVVPPPWEALEHEICIAALHEGVHVSFAERFDVLATLLPDYCRCLHAARSATAPAGAVAGGGLAVTKSSTRRSGSSLTDTWRRILATISRVTPACADAIVSEFPTLGALLGTYVQAGEAQGEAALAGVSVGARRLGMAVSRRIHRILAATGDGSQQAYL